MAIPRSCSRGLRSRPSSGTGYRRSKGLEVSRVNKRKPTLMSPMTPSTRARMGSSSWSENTATANVQPARIRLHSRIEPSWLPHTAVMR
ncbi:hypothetical protein Y695_02320 [Hydrogenophaga sp. T4]|nr:hypothetical protein Y695_02320 [Hydrogenophaga sp. T4]